MAIITFATDPDGAHEAFRRDGFFIEPELFSPAECDALIELARGFPSALDGTLLPAMNPHRFAPEVLRTMRHPPLRGIMERLLGGRILGLQTELFFGRPGTKGFAIHQDNHYVRAPYDAFGSAWLALDDVDPGNGSLIVYPGSHREGLLDVRDTGRSASAGQDPNARSQEAVLPADYRPFDVVARRGSVVLIHGHVAHSSHDNVSADRFRHVLLMTYIRDGAPFRSGRYARREAFDLHDGTAAT